LFPRLLLLFMFILFLLFYSLIFLRPPAQSSKAKISKIFSLLLRKESIVMLLRLSLLQGTVQKRVASTFHANVDWMDLLISHISKIRVARNAGTSWWRLRWREIVRRKPITLNSCWLQSRQHRQSSHHLAGARTLQPLQPASHAADDTNKKLRHSNSHHSDDSSFPFSSCRYYNVSKSLSKNVALR